VYEIGGYAFGKPLRITASAAMGKAGIINIERESNLSGSFHDKGVQIIAGYLRRTFAQDKPLSLAASLCFEQSYGGVEGDSASAAEVFALLSALANLPIRQEIAVTGSMSQEGDIQPIGGVNQKIEGFFDACRIKGGLTGGQGVLIPAANVEDLMLREEVVDAVARGEFHIFPIATVEEGIEILTGRGTGRRNGQAAEEVGKSNSLGVHAIPFTEGGVFALVDDRLRQMAEILREYE